MKRNYLQFSYLTLIYILLYLPIAVIVVFSFNDAERSLLWHGFTWHWYQVLFHDSNLAIITLHSFTVAMTAAISATVLGTVTALTMHRYQFWGKNIFNGLILSMIVMPDIVMAVSLLLIFSVVHFPLGFLSLYLAHTSLCVPFVCITISARLQGLNKHLVEAGKDLGASEWTVLTRILLPLLWPAILTAALLCFTLSLDDVIISYFVSGPDYQILPLHIYALVRHGVKPEISALCSVLLLFTLLIVLLSRYWMDKKTIPNSETVKS